MARSLSMTCSLSMCTLARSRSPSLDEHSRYVVLSFLVGVASVYTSCPEATRHKAAIRGDYKICTSDTDRRQPTLPCPTAPSQNHVKPYFRVGNRLFLEYGRPHPTAKHNGNARGGGGTLTHLSQSVLLEKEALCIFKIYDFRSGCFIA
jgi:hypothetical protein